MSISSYVVHCTKETGNIYCVKEFVCPSVTKFDLNYLWTGEIEWDEIFWGISLSKSVVP